MTIQEADRLYEEIAQNIRVHFSETTRETGLLEREVGFGMYGFATEIHNAYGAKRKISGLFPMTCYYESGIYRSPYAKTSSPSGTVHVTKTASTYCARAGEAHTIKSISVASDYGEEWIIADIMIAAVCEEILHYRWGTDIYIPTANADIYVPAADAISIKAKTVMSKHGYGWWHPSAKYFVFRMHRGGENDPIDKLKICLSNKEADPKEIADLIISVFSDIIGDAEVNCEIVHRNVQLQQAFLYEQTLRNFIEDVSVKYDTGKYSDSDAACHISHIASVIRKNTYQHYSLDQVHYELVHAVDSRIDKMLDILKEKIPGIDTLLKEEAQSNKSIGGTNAAIHA